MINQLQFFLQLLLNLTILSITIFANPISTNCDKSKCHAPFEFYKELGCRAIYRKNDECCPERFICHQYSSKKCVKGGYEYNVGQKLPLKNHKKMWCRCEELINSTDFKCNFDPNNSHEKESEKIVKCLVDGKQYYDGQFFQPKDEPQKSCFCSAGYTGMNIEPFCIKTTRCNIGFKFKKNIEKKCAPVYDYNKSKKDCIKSFRCQNELDVVVPRLSPHESSIGNVCLFGNLTLKIGESLIKQEKTECSCIIPPVLTCHLGL